MNTIHLVFFDAGGGHRSAANALKEVIRRQQRPWRTQMVNLQEVLDSLDVFRKLTGVRMQDLYNTTLRRGWTLGSAQMTRAMHGVIRLYHSRQVRMLAEFWRRNPADLVVSLIPNFNRALFQGLARACPNTPLLTILTDLADYPPHFWIERQEQYLVCGTQRAVEQARKLGYPARRICRTSGMILHPRFYEQVDIDLGAERQKFGLDAGLPTGLVLFGGHGSSDIEDVADRIDESDLGVQLVLLCGHNAALAARLRNREWRIPVHVEGFTREVPHFMRISDFFIGKPGPGSISEAIAMNLPVIVERNRWTLPQERYNATWIREQGVGLVLRSYRNIVSAVDELLQPLNYAGFKKRVGEQHNRAVFEVPEIVQGLLAKQVCAEHEPSCPTP